MELSRLLCRSIMEPRREWRAGTGIRTGEVRTDVVDDHILVMTVDRVEKKNAFTPRSDRARRRASPGSTRTPSCSSAC